MTEGLNCGSGPWYCPGWMNIDRYAEDADWSGDVRKMPKTWRSKFERVYMGHFLEHIPFDEIPTLFKEIFRVCKHGAEVVVVGPAMDKGLETGQPDWLLKQMGKSSDEDLLAMPGAGNAWEATTELTLEAMRLGGLTGVEEIDIDSRVYPEWPNRNAHRWQVAAHGFGNKGGGKS